MKRITPFLAALLIAAAMMQGCTTVIGVQPGQYPPALPPQSVAQQPANGTVYQANTALSLFDDVKARRIGDTVTIVLNERTQASKNASTDASKDSAFDSGTPIFLGDSVTLNGEDVLNNSWETEQSFAGEGSSSQSNSLDGSITVTVADVFPNGNLLVRGEKWLTLNQGEEYVQIQGIVRPADIGTDNRVPSFKVADARITYSGNGAIADANKPGFLSRFFMKIWPL